MRVVQTGRGDTRPLVLVYLLGSSVDPALRAAAGPDAMIVNITEPSGSNYTDTPSLADTVAKLSADAGGIAFSPVVVAGFSAGGFATRFILAQGGDPDAIVVADGTYSSTPAGYAEWAKYAKRAMVGDRVFIASHTSLVVPSSTWHVLAAISGLELPLGANVLNRPPGVPVLPLPGPVRHELGNFVIYSYPTQDGAGHQAQGAKVLPMMLGEAMSKLGVAGAGGVTTSKSSAGLVLGAIGLGIAAIFAVTRRSK